MLPAGARAQDAHYWSIQNGSRATLLGGSVVARDNDLSAAFYNPGSLVRGTNGDALSMFAKTSTELSLSFQTSPSVTATSNIGASAPGMFAARIPRVHITDDDVITFSYLVHQTSKLDMSGSILTSSTVPAEALELFIFQDIYDGWYGLSWAREAGEFGVGVTLFYSSVSYRQRLETRDAAINSPTEAGVLSEDVYYAFSCRRMIAKGGASWTHGPVSVGGTLTLPSIGLPWSSGTLSVSRNLVIADTTLSAQIASSRQEDLDASYREPLSVALGVQVTAGAFDFHASAEYFASIDEYDVLEAEPLVSQVPPQEFDLNIAQSRTDVLNVGVGVSVNATSWLSFFGSARTDKSYRNPDDPRPLVGLGGYDLFHATAGIGLSNDNLEVHLGGIFASGDADGSLTISPLPSAPTVPTRTEFDQTGFVLAFSASF